MCVYVYIYIYIHMYIYIVTTIYYRMMITIQISYSIIINYLYTIYDYLILSSIIRYYTLYSICIPGSSK